MGLFSSSKPVTAVSTETSAILIEGPDKAASKIVNLVQLLQMSESSSVECGKILRKTLKNGNSPEQLNALALLETLVDNGVKTSALITHSGLCDQLIFQASRYTMSKRASLSTDAKVSRSAHRLLSSWADRPDKTISQLSAKAGLKSAVGDKKNKRLSDHPDDDLDGSLFTAGTGSPFDDPEPMRELSLGQSVRNSLRLELANEAAEMNTNGPAASANGSGNRRSLPRAVDNVKRHSKQQDKQWRHRSTHPDEDLDNAFDLSESDSSSDNGASGENKRQSFPFFRWSRRSDVPTNQTSKRASYSAKQVQRAEEIANTINVAHTVATKLMNVLIVDSAMKDANQYYGQAKTLRKQVLSLIEDTNPDVQEFIGQLLAANEELVSAIKSYDSLTGSGDSTAPRSSNKQPSADENPFSDQAKQSVPIYN